VIPKPYHEVFLCLALFSLISDFEHGHYTRAQTKVETPIHNNIRGIGNLGVQRARSEIMNVLGYPKRKCWALKYEFLEA
jgi:hypothetical protein